MLSLMVHQVGAFWGQFAPTSPQPVRCTRGALDLLDNFNNCRGFDHSLSRPRPSPEEAAGSVEEGPTATFPVWPGVARCGPVWPGVARCGVHDPILTSHLTGGMMG